MALKLVDDKTAYQIKVTLLDLEPPVWRRLLTRSDIPLLKLHKIIQRVMGWTDSHLHQFMAGKQYYGQPEPRGFGFGGGPKVLSERTHTLGQVLHRAGMKLLYEYDMGDSWMHEVVVEKRLPVDPALRYPVCLEGARACPPEDCGGPPGYEGLLAALADPDHPEHEEAKDWVGEDLDPERFDLAAVNRALARLRRG